MHLFGDFDNSGISNAWLEGIALLILNKFLVRNLNLDISFTMFLLMFEAAPIYDTSAECYLQNVNCSGFAFAFAAVLFKVYFHLLYSIEPSYFLVLSV